MQCWRHRLGWEDKHQLWVCPSLQTLPLCAPLPPGSPLLCLCSTSSHPGHPITACPSCIPTFPPSKFMFSLASQHSPLVALKPPDF